MEELPRDILFKTALDLDFSDILRLCKSDEKINEKLCEGDNLFWKEKLLRDFHVDYNKLQTTESSRDMYYELHENFQSALTSLFQEGYPDKLKNFLIKSGYVKEFQNTISEVLGEYYNQIMDPDDYDDLTARISDILPSYFFDGGESSGFYPLVDIDYYFMKAFKVKEF